MTDQNAAPEAPARKPLVVPTALERALGRLFAPRMAVWLYLSLALLGLVWWLAQHMLAVILYKVVIITIAAFVADKIARAAEKSNPRPHTHLERANTIWEKVVSENMNGEQRAIAAARAHQLELLANKAYDRRAWIIVGCVIAGALGS